MHHWSENKALLIPSLFTLLNLCCGTIAIFLSIKQNFTSAAWMIIIAVLCDGLDGKIARWVDAESSFGLQLDSFADLISSGVAPIVLVYNSILTKFPWYYAWICLVFVFSGAYRLARFNIIQKGDRSQGYTGLPIPVAGMTIAAYWLFYEFFREVPGLIISTILVFICSILMMSTIPYAWPKLIWNQGYLKQIASVCLLLGTALMIVFTKYSLFPLLCAYIIVGFGKWFIVTVREAIIVDFMK